jgi:predicted nucleic acid-binding protein
VSRIYWDAMLFIYLIEQPPEHGSRMTHLLDRMSTRGDSLCTSIFTLGEVLTGPYKQGAHDLAQEIKKFIGPPDVDLLPFTADAADQYARIRAMNRASPADSIHLASAASAGVDLFLTNDRTLQKMIVPGIQFVAGVDVNLF